MGTAIQRTRAIAVAGATVLAAAVMAPASASAATRVQATKLFPSNAQTVKDRRQLTGRRVRLPRPDCAKRPSDCNEIRLVNQLDGFDIDPRVAIRFNRPIRVRKVTKRSVYIRRASGGPRIGLRRLVWSPARNTLFGSPEHQLEESTTYRLVVNRKISRRTRQTRFTTMSATRALVQMRRQLDDGSAYERAAIPAAERGLRFVRGDGTRTVFPATQVLRIRRFNDTGAALAEELVPNTAVENAGLYAFGSFLSPSWLDGRRVIRSTPTKTGAPRVRGMEEVGFTLIVPAGAKPAGGFPVAIFGPGFTRSKYDLFLAADRNAARGVATIAIDPVGHAFGPRSEVAVDTLLPPQTVRFSGFGRGRDLNGDGRINEQEGVQAPSQPDPLAAIALRDGLRQTALDNMALVRAIERGADVDADGSVDLRTTGVSLYAQSLGGIYGTMLMGVDPRVGVGVLNVPGGPITEIARLAPGFRPLAAAELRNRVPSLLNGGRDGFTESTPLFADPPVLAPARGAVAIQESGSRVNWVDRSGSPEAFAPLIRRSPPSDSAPKKVIYQIAYGDRTVSNPTSATLLRAGGLLDVTTVYRNDLTPTASTNPHGYLLDPRLAGRGGGQQQMLEFIVSGGSAFFDPDGAGTTFEVPIADPLEIERLNFDVPPAEGEPPPEQRRR